MYHYRKLPYTLIVPDGVLKNQLRAHGPYYLSGIFVFSMIGQLF